MSEDTVVFGLDLDEEYQNIDISEAKGSEPEEPHLMPTQNSRAPLETGSLGYIDSETSSSSTRPASYLEGKGFGWLLEVEEDDEELKPLL